MKIPQKGIELKELVKTGKINIGVVQYTQKKLTHGQEQENMTVKIIIWRHYKCLHLEALNSISYFNITKTDENV